MRVKSNIEQRYTIGNYSSSSRIKRVKYALQFLLKRFQNQRGVCLLLQ